MSEFLSERGAERELQEERDGLFELDVIGK